MKVKFLGAIDTESKGCSSCGGRRSKNKLATIKEYYLPSGMVKTFVIGRVTEVSDSDGSFLIGLGEFEKC